MGKPEALVEKYLCAKAKELDYLVFKLTCPGHTGVPDRLIIGNGQTVFVEVKAATGRLSDKQKVLIPDMRNHGATVYVVNSRDQVNTLLGYMQQNTTTTMQHQPL